MFSKSCEYGIRAMIYLAALQERGKKAGVTELADEIGSPKAFTAKILQRLVRAGLLASTKGPRGGFYLPREADEMKILDIVIAIDGPGVVHNCVLGFEKCSSDQPCPLHNEFLEVRDHLTEVLANTRLKDAEKTFTSGAAILKQISKN